MHCVGDYPTPTSSADLSRILTLRDTFPDIEIGFSTHESPDEVSLASHARAMGCTIFEKHVGKKTDTVNLNAYSCTREQYENMIVDLMRYQSAFEGKSNTQKQSLRNLKRGVYIREDLPKGHTLSEEDLFYAMPCQEDQLDVSKIDMVLGSALEVAKSRNEKLCLENIINKTDDETHKICDSVREVLEHAKIPVTPKDKCEISCHYGLENFERYGAFIIDKVNREYCKKLIVMLPGQKHPEHYHIRKEETFELIHGDCSIAVKGKTVDLKLGEPFLIVRNVPHAFQTLNGCVIEEVSTTHHRGDSIYTDPSILRKEVKDRKVTCNIYRKKI